MLYNAYNLKCRMVVYFEKKEYKVNNQLAEHDVRTEKCSDTCQHNIKFVLTFAKKDLTLAETYARSIALNFWLGHMSDQSGNCTGKHQKWSQNVRCLSVISCPGVTWRA